MKTSTRFRFGRWVCLTLMVGLIVSLTYFAYAHRDADPDSKTDTANDATCSASAVHWHADGYGDDGERGYNNWQYAGFHASVGSKKDIGHKVHGSYSVAALVFGWAPRHGAKGDSFTLKVRGFKIFGKEVKWGESTSEYRSDYGFSSSPTTQGYAKAKSAVGTVKTKQCKT